MSGERTVTAAPQPEDEPARRRIINGPSWAAFLFLSIYLAAMRAYRHALLSFVLLFIPVVGIVAWIYYGLRGKRIAWTTRRWRDFDDFLACQRVWDRWAKMLTALILLVAVLVLLVVLVFPPVCCPPPLVSRRADSRMQSSAPGDAPSSAPLMRQIRSYEEAAYPRGLFDEPMAALYQVWSLVGTLEEAVRPRPSP